MASNSDPRRSQPFPSSFKPPLPLNSMNSSTFFMYTQGTTTPQFGQTSPYTYEPSTYPVSSPMDTYKAHSQPTLSVSDDELQQLYVNDANLAAFSRGLPQVRSNTQTMFTASPMISSEPSPRFAPSSTSSVPMTTSYSMSPPSTGLPEPPLPLTPYTQFPSLFPGQHDQQGDSAYSPSVNNPVFHNASAQSTQQDNMFGVHDTFATNHQQPQYASYNFASLSSPNMSAHLGAGYNPMSAPAELTTGHGLLHSDQSLLGAFGMSSHALGLKMEDDEDMSMHNSSSLSPHMFGIGPPIRTPSGVLGEEESQFSMEMDDDTVGGSPATLYPRPSPLTHSSSASQLDTRTIRYERIPGSSHLGMYNSQGQLIPCPSSAPPIAGGMFGSDASMVFGDRTLQESPSPPMHPSSINDKRRPRRASQQADDAEYLDPSSVPRRPRMRATTSGPGSLPAPRPKMSSSNSSAGLPSVGPNEMVITASIPMRGLRGRASTMFGGRAPRSVVPTPVPNLTKKSRGRRVPVARPLDMEEMHSSAGTNASVIVPTRRSSRVSVTPVSATDVDNDNDDSVGNDVDDDDDDEFPSPSGSKPKAGGKSKMSPRMQALVDEAIARGCSTTASGKARIFTCPVGSCLKCFARGEHLKRHVRSIHTEEKPFECDHQGCGKKFSRHDNLKQHKRVHKDKVPGSGPKVDMGLLQFDLEPLEDD